jgi:hypothetical protein
MEGEIYIIILLPRMEEQAGENVGRNKLMETSYTSTHIKWKRKRMGRRREEKKRFSRM